MKIFNTKNDKNGSELYIEAILFDEKIKEASKKYEEALEIKKNLLFLLCSDYLNLNEVEIKCL